MKALLQRSIGRNQEIRVVIMMVVQFLMIKVQNTKMTGEEENLMTKRITNTEVMTNNILMWKRNLIEATKKSLLMTGKGLIHVLLMRILV